MPVAETFDEQLAIWIEYDLDDTCVVKRDTNLITKRPVPLDGGKGPDFG